MRMWQGPVQSRSAIEACCQESCGRLKENVGIVVQRGAIDRLVYVCSCYECRCVTQDGDPMTLETGGRSQGVFQKNQGCG
jgi:hypothetical protein